MPTLEHLQPDQPSLRRGHPQPYGATCMDGGVNFAVFSRHATAMTLVLFRLGDDHPCREIPLDPASHRTGDVWHVFLAGLEPGFGYGYRAAREVPDQQAGTGHFFNPEKILFDPYARVLDGPSVWQGDDRATVHTAQWQGLILKDDFDWQDDRPPGHHLADLVIYEMHVRGFTRDSSSGVAAPGTYRGVIEKIPYLQELGVNAVELLPVTAFNEADNYRKNPLTGEELFNFWGYHPISFFAPKAAYAAEPSPTAPLNEFREMVKALHAAGIEVILDVVFNHTGEGNELGPALSLRGLDNSVYYLIDSETGDFLNYSGCGNTVNCNHPVVRDLIIDALCFWVTEMHVDGFRFDLASILGRGTQGEVLANPPLIERIAAHPVLADTKLIAEAWDAAGLYQVGNFPNFGRWAEWNGKFRDDLRRFVRGDRGMVPVLATRLSGSSDLYQHDGRAPFHSINFVTCHDGFTLADLVSYEHKHNEGNGEFNSDGTEHNFSANYGVEGPTEDPEILALRRRQAYNFATLLILAHGVPMLLAGDEMGRTQHGNNNTWCQDNRLGWMVWEDLERNADLFRCVQRLIRFRQRHDLLRPRQFSGEEAGQRSLTWHGRRFGHPDWSEQCHELGMHLKSLNGEGDAEIYLFANAARKGVDAELPPLPPGKAWSRLVDTAVAGENAVREPGAELRLEHQQTYHVAAKTVLVLISGPA